MSSGVCLLVCLLCLYLATVQADSYPSHYHHPALHPRTASIGTFWASWMPEKLRKPFFSGALFFLFQVCVFFSLSVYVCVFFGRES